MVLQTQDQQDARNHESDFLRDTQIQSKIEKLRVTHAGGTVFFCPFLWFACPGPPLDNPTQAYGGKHINSFLYQNVRASH